MAHLRPHPAVERPLPRPHRRPSGRDLDRPRGPRDAGPARGGHGRHTGEPGPREVAAGELVATAMAGVDGHRGWLYYVAVDPRLQGRGRAVRRSSRRRRGSPPRARGPCASWCAPRTTRCVASTSGSGTRTRSASCSAARSAPRTPATPDDEPRRVAAGRRRPRRPRDRARARVAALDPLVAVPALGATTDDERLLAVRLPDGSRRGLLGVGTSGRTPWRRGSALREHRLQARAADRTWVARSARSWRSGRRAWGATQVGHRRATGCPSGAPRPATTAWRSCGRAATSRPWARSRRAACARPSTSPRAAAPPRSGPATSSRDRAGRRRPGRRDRRRRAPARRARVRRARGRGRVRPLAAEHLAAQVAAAVENPRTTVLVARRQVPGSGRARSWASSRSSPERSGAVAGTVAAGPVAYLVLLHVTGSARHRPRWGARRRGARARARAGGAGRRRRAAPRRAQPAVRALLGAAGLPARAHHVERPVDALSAPRRSLSP